MDQTSKSTQTAVPMTRCRRRSQSQPTAASALNGNSAGEGVKRFGRRVGRHAQTQPNKPEAKEADHAENQEPFRTDLTYESCERERSSDDQAAGKSQD